MHVIRSREELEALRERRAGSISEVRLEALDLSGIDLSQTYWTKVELQSVVLREADLRGTRWTEASWEDVDLTQARLDGWAIRDSTITPTCLDEAAAANATMDGVRVEACSLRSADVHAAVLTKVTLTSTDLTSADLSDARWLTCRVIDAPLLEASLAGGLFEEVTMVRDGSPELDLRGAGGTSA